MCGNRGQQYISRGGQIINNNLSRGSAISIEYPFKANTTYEISLQTYFNDNILLVDKVNSNGFPTLYAQLKDSGLIIDGSEACETNNIIRILEMNPNNLKSYTLNNSIKEDKTIIFKFSLTEEKKALLLALNPKTGENNGVGSSIPTNSYTMVLPMITITEKAFDPSILVPIPPGRR
ncbi:hypothetical protein J2Y38_001823 [Flavobacterium sp. 2755]|uniref:hypothetical protein n=1 Tax=Flavobacterium sp. 2755 TaxID=2817765 RepID=UPI002854BDA7|nr:hypothetical protein [Flavobacterium sp. 2755]MDR6761614.1 hypothetical protein [Flavobacterium sp. 2755]